MTASFQSWLTSWSSLADWSVAVGTALLAAGTAWLAHRTREGTQEFGRERVEARNRERATAMLEFVGHAANASALYHLAFRSLKSVLSTNASPGVVEAAQSALDRAEARRQDAYATYFRIQVEYGARSTAAAAAQRFLRAVDRQRAVGLHVLAWAANPQRITHPSGWPRIDNIRRPTLTEREDCIAEATAQLADK
jgi:hypothetical protein